MPKFSTLRPQTQILNIRTHAQIFKYFLTPSCQPNTKTQTNLQQEHKHKPSSRSLLLAKHKNTNWSLTRTETQTQQWISRQPNTKKKTHTQKSARKQTQIQTQTHQSIFSNNPTIQTQNHNDLRFETQRSKTKLKPMIQNLQTHHIHIHKL